MLQCTPHHPRHHQSHVSSDSASPTNASRLLQHPSAPTPIVQCTKRPHVATRSTAGFQSPAPHFLSVHPTTVGAQIPLRHPCGPQTNHTQFSTPCWPLQHTETSPERTPCSQRAHRLTTGAPLTFPRASHTLSTTPSHASDPSIHVPRRRFPERPDALTTRRDQPSAFAIPLCRSALQNARVHHPLSSRLSIASRRAA